MAAVIQLAKPGRGKYFGDYTQMHLLPFLEKQVHNNTTRVDAEWDISYSEAILTSQKKEEWFKFLSAEVQKECKHKRYHLLPQKGI